MQPDEDNILIGKSKSTVPSSRNVYETPVFGQKLQEEQKVDETLYEENFVKNMASGNFKSYLRNTDEDDDDNIIRMTSSFRNKPTGGNDRTTTYSRLKDLNDIVAYGEYEDNETMKVKNNSKILEDKYLSDDG